ncbi:unnamed protein product [Knipowitschia caucasica]|uniref:Peptidase M60 domain-containing protein n=1 Tax=Knipowitschia caucasica TaxID=637954 RepID=A0AAV2JEY5_KNICA
MWSHGIYAVMVCTLTHSPFFTMASSLQQSYSALTSGLTELNLEAPSVPGVFLLSGAHAFPLVTNSQGQVQVAASGYGSGRLLALSHGSYVRSVPELMEKALDWLRGDSQNLEVGVQQSLKDLKDQTFKTKFQFKVLERFSSYQGIRVFVTDATSVEGSAEEIVAFLKGGGGVLIAGQASDWAAQNPDQNVLVQFPGNKVSSVAGVYFVGEKGESKRFSIGPKIPDWKTIVLSDSFTEERKTLLEGVTELRLRESAYASQVLVHGLLSFPIAWNQEGAVFLAGAYYGKGRVIAASHSRMLEDNPVFWGNALRWLDRGRQGTVGYDAYHTAVVLSQTGFRLEEGLFKAGLSVYVATHYKDEQIQEMLDFVAEGGGLVLAGQAWTFTQNSDANYLVELAGNKLLNPAGITLLSSIMGGGVFKAPGPEAPVRDHHFSHTLSTFVGFVSGNKVLSPEEETAMKANIPHIQAYIKTYNHQNYYYQQTLATLVQVLKKSGLPQVSESSPATSWKDKMLLSLVSGVYEASTETLQDELLKTLHPNQSQLPMVQNQRVRVSADTGDGEEWISTGLYLPPGLKTNVTVPVEMVGKNWKVQISCQSDELDTKDDLYRAPVVSERFMVSAETTMVQNVWGGLIYLIAPPKTKVTAAEVTVQEAVRCPYYRSGETSLEDWLQMRSAPGPWAELEFENLILTVPSGVVRTMDRPDEVAALWDKIMRAIADLSGIPHKFQRKERIVTEVQISAGLMHAGYPIMGHTPKAKVMTNFAEIKKVGLWGPIHELGHNQQRWQSEFWPNTREATCNLWSVYVSETVLGFTVDMYQGNDVTAEFRAGVIEKFVKDGKKLDDWNTWVAFETYLQLKEKFGWDAYKKVFAAYQAMDDSQITNDNTFKMNLYAETFSRIVGMDLTGFLKSWSWPIQDKTVEALSSLPDWNDHPMVQHN